MDLKDLKDRAILGKTISDEIIRGQMPEITINLGMAMIGIAEKVDNCLACNEEQTDWIIECYKKQAMIMFSFKKTLLNHFKNHLIEI